MSLTFDAPHHGICGRSTPAAWSTRLPSASCRRFGPAGPASLRWVRIDRILIRVAHSSGGGQIYASISNSRFNSDERGSYDAERARLALQRAIDFFRQHIG